METKNKRTTKKAFYIISSLSRDNSWQQLAHRKMFYSEREALESAANLVKHREDTGQAPLSFFVLKSVARVGYAKPPISITKLS